MSRKKDQNTLIECPEYSGLVAEMEAAKESVKAKGKAAVHALFRAFFAAHPGVTAIGWTQYTPNFNDGDACVFGVNDFHWTDREGVDFESVERLYSDDDEPVFYDEYSSVVKKDPKKRTLAEAVSGLERQKDDDIFETAFGDHVMVIATPDGFHVNEYDHD